MGGEEGWGFAGGHAGEDVEPEDGARVEVGGFVFVEALLGGAPGREAGNVGFDERRGGLQVHLPFGLAALEEL